MDLLRRAGCVLLAVLLLLAGLISCAPQPQETPSAPQEESSLPIQEPSSDPPEKELPLWQSIPESGPTNAPPVSIEASAALLYEQGADHLLYAKNLHKPVAPASLAKLVTACTALELLPPDTVFEVGDELDSVLPGSSICLLQKGHRLSLNALLYGLMLRSGNDAAYVIAVHTARAVRKAPGLPVEEALAEFQKLEAAFLAGLGADESCFSTPDGFDKEGQHTTAYDLLRIALCAHETPALAEVMATTEKKVVFASGQIANWKNTNKLLLEGSPYFDPDASGMKTGTTPEAGCCLVASAVKNGKLRIAVILGCSSDAERYQSAVSLLNL